MWKRLEDIPFGTAENNNRVLYVNEANKVSMVVTAEDLVKKSLETSTSVGTIFNSKVASAISSNTDVQNAFNTQVSNAITNSTTVQTSLTAQVGGGGGGGGSGHNGVEVQTQKETIFGMQIPFGVSSTLQDPSAYSDPKDSNNTVIILRYPPDTSETYDGTNWATVRDSSADNYFLVAPFDYPENFEARVINDTGVDITLIAWDPVNIGSVTSNQWASQSAIDAVYPNMNLAWSAGTYHFEDKDSSTFLTLPNGVMAHFIATGEQNNSGLGVFFSTP